MSRRPFTFQGEGVPAQVQRVVCQPDRVVPRRGFDSHLGRADRPVHRGTSIAGPESGSRVPGQLTGPVVGIASMNALDAHHRSQMQPLPRAEAEAVNDRFRDQGVRDR